jgi:hypothetical protein
MNPRSLQRAVVSVVVVALCGGLASRPALVEPVSAEPAAPRLSDHEYWKLIADLSEPDGTFRSENLLSNELGFQRVIPELVRSATPARAYLGVGPEQNFSYIAAVRPSVAFIIDVRRGNLDLHLLYKAVFELASDRVDFVSLLFSRPRPRNVGQGATAREVFDAVLASPASEALFLENAASIRNQLSTRHGFDVSENDLRGIEFVHRAFFMFGPQIRYSPIGLGAGTTQPTYVQLMAATDEEGVSRSYLATEQTFSYVKDLEGRNLIVPVVGNFAGRKALRAIGEHLHRQGDKVSTFYVSNVEEYLKRDGSLRAFCDNVAALPVDDTSVFIRSFRNGDAYAQAEGMVSELSPMISCGRDGR